VKKQINRRDFLQLSAAALGSVAVSRFSCGDQPSGKMDKFGIQLYSVRDVFEKDPAGTIRELAKMGYHQLESYERQEDMFWGLTPQGFKKLADELGLSLVSSHCEIEKNFEKKVEQAASIGMQYLVYNWPFSQVTMDEYRVKADLFNRCGELAGKAGLHFAYHNYSSSYQLLDGIYPQDLLMDRTDPQLVHQQMDVYWLVRAGQDPLAWLKKYPGRYRLSHVKDGNNRETCELGQGNIDYSAILPVAISHGMKFFFVEQEHYPGAGPMESARRNAGYMKGIRF
jgi:sugar phosphate isomerase/epimerase